MRLRLTALALAGVCGMALVAGQARANVIYDFTTTSVTGLNPTFPGSLGTPFASFSLPESTVASGAFVLDVAAGFGMPAPAGTAAFDYLNLPVHLTPDNLAGIVDVAFAFSAAGDVTRTHVYTHNPIGIDLTLDGAGSAASGVYASDGPECHDPATSGMGGSCAISGAWTHTAYAAPVPEPASFALLGIGVLGLGLVRGRKRTAI